MQQITDIISLVFLVDQDRVLLTMNSDRPNKITWNGIASVADSAIGQEIIKDVYRLTKLTMYEHDLKQVGMLHYFMIDNRDTRQKILTVTIYISHKWQGKAINTTGTRPTWFDFNQIPYSDMTDDCKEWLPKILDGDKIIVEVYSKLDPISQNELIQEVLIRSIL